MATQAQGPGQRRYVVILVISVLAIALGILIELLSSLGISLIRDPWATLPLVHRFMVIGAAVLIGGGVTIWILGSLGVIPGPWATILQVRRINVIIVVSLIGVGAVIWILSSLGIMPASWATLLTQGFNALGVLFAFLALVPLLTHSLTPQRSEG